MGNLTTIIYVIICVEKIVNKKTQLWLRKLAKELWVFQVFRKIRSRNTGSGDKQYFRFCAKTSKALLITNRILFWCSEFASVSYVNATLLWSWKICSFNPSLLMETPIFNEVWSILKWFSQLTVLSNGTLSLSVSLRTRSPLKKLFYLPLGSSHNCKSASGEGANHWRCRMASWAGQWGGRW